MLALGALSAGCGSQAAAPRSTHPSVATPPSPASVPGAHPQAVDPAAGQEAPNSGGQDGDQGAADTGDGQAPVGDTSAHAPPLSQIKQELQQLNMCGGTTNADAAAPVASAGGPGFVPDPGTQQTEGQLPILTARLDELAKALGVVIYGISGYRSPAHSVAVGGYADDPHTRGEAEDIGVNSVLRSSAAQISEAELAKFGLYRPFDPSDDPNNSEVNHIQLIEAGGPLTLVQAQSTFDPDPSCS